MVGPFFKNQKLGGTRLALWALLLCSACGGPAPEEYIHQLKSMQKAERVKAANQLIRFDADEVVPLLIEEADSGYIRVRFEVMHLLGRFEDERAVPTLIAALKDKSPRVAATAAWALGQIGAPAALAPLLKYVRDPTVEVRQYVLGALGPCHSYEAEPALSDSAFRVVRAPCARPSPSGGLPPCRVCVPMGTATRCKKSFACRWTPRTRCVTWPCKPSARSVAQRSAPARSQRHLRGPVGRPRRRRTPEHPQQGRASPRRGGR